MQRPASPAAQRRAFERAHDPKVAKELLGKLSDDEREAFLRHGVKRTRQPVEALPAHLRPRGA
jgi:hypothetical protein